MKSSAIQVAIDILRELGREDVARWVEHPDAVRELLLHDPAMDEPGIGLVCPRCDAPEGEAHNLTMKGDPFGLSYACPIAAAWRALGDPRGAADIERAHEEALTENYDRRARKSNRGGPWDLSPERGFTFTA